MAVPRDLKKIHEIKLVNGKIVSITNFSQLERRRIKPDVSEFLETGRPIRGHASKLFVDEGYQSRGLGKRSRRKVHSIQRINGKIVNLTHDSQLERRRIKPHIGRLLGSGKSVTGHASTLFVDLGVESRSLGTRQGSRRRRGH